MVSASIMEMITTIPITARIICCARILRWLDVIFDRFCAPVCLLGFAMIYLAICSGVYFPQTIIFYQRFNKSYHISFNGKQPVARYDSSW